MNNKRLLILTGIVILSLTLVSMWSLFLSGPLELAHAAGPWYVAPGGSDSNSCLSAIAPCATINGAIGKANPGDTIYVAKGTYIGNGDVVLLLNKSVTLSGAWDDTFTTQSGTSTIDGEDARRGITVNSGVVAIVERFVVQNGWSDWVVGDGGGISNSGTLTLNSSTVNGNMVVSTFINGGGIYNVGIMVLNNSIVSGNMARDGTGDGIYSSDGTMTFNNSTVSDNMSGGIYFNNSTVTLNNSTVSGNMGGGIRNSGGILTLNNSTVSDNTANSGGGINQNGGTVILNNSTISGNTANGGGGGISKGGGTMTLQNTILTDNISRVGISPDCSGEIGTVGYNLIGDTSGCNFTPGTGDLTDVGANLGELIGIPDAPMYRPLLSGSPAIDAGNPAGCTGSSGPLLTDQRGVARHQGPACDIGAYEYTPPGSAASIYAIGGTPQRTPPSFAFWMPLQAAVMDSIGSPVNNATVNFSAPASGASGTFADSVAFTTTAVTDEGGVATAATFTANGLEGSYTVTATVGSVVTPTNFSLGNIGWYVAPGGNDGNDCQTPATTCATINGTLSKAGFTAGDTVLVAIGTYTGTGDEVVLLDKSVRLLGGWDNIFTTQSSTSTIDGEDARRGITVNSGVTVIVERFTVQNGLVDSGAGGGGILNTGDTLTINNSTVSGNMTSGRGGGIRNYHGSTLSLNNSTVSGNMGDAGGGISNEAYMNLNNSTVSGNTANVNGGGGIRNDGDIDLNSSTVSDNDSLGIPANSPSGGGIYSVFGTITLNNSTVSNNMASSARGGGIFNYGSTVILNNSTVSRNTASFGGGIFNNSGSMTSASVTLKNSIVAGNTASESGPDCIRIDSTGHNLIDDTSGCTFTPTTGDLTDIDARLLPFTGSPGYHPLSRYSPAVDAGNPNGCEDHLGNPLVTDQRGVARVGRCDIGSYEYDPASDPFNYIFLACITKNYCPNFFDEFNNPASGWFVWEDEYAQWEFLDGEYRILTKDDRYLFYSDAPTCARENYTVEVDARWVGETGEGYGILFGHNWDVVDQFYIFEVNTDYQDYNLARYDGVEYHSIVPFTYSPYINYGMSSNHLKITRNGFQITLEVNGIVLGTWTDGNITGATYTGIFSEAYTGYPTSDARFDNFSVTQVSSVEQSSAIHSNSMAPVISPRTYKFAPHRQDYLTDSEQLIR